MICLHSKGLPYIEDLQDIRAETEKSLDKDQEICSDESMDIIKKLKEDREISKKALIEEIKENNPEAMFADGRLKDETEMALYIIEEMGDDVSSVTDKSDGSKSSMIDKVIQTGPGGSPSPQKSLDDQAYDYAINNPNDPRSQEILNRLGRK